MSSQPVDIEDLKANYREMIGLVPPKVAKRLEFSATVDPDGLRQLEAIRKDFLASEHIDQTTVQLIAFAILLTQTSPASEFHARAALRAGASKEQLMDAAKVAFLFRGLAAMNQAGEVLSRVFAPEEGTQN